MRVVRWPSPKTSSRQTDIDRKAALARILSEAESGELVFSTHAEVALRVRLALEDPQLHLDDVARLVQAEPLLATRVVALANSVAFNRSAQTIGYVKSAVAIVGVQLVRLLATALIMRQMVGEAASERQRQLAQGLWHHCAQIAALAHVLAHRLTSQAPDLALFGGMVHEIGGFYLIARANDYPQLLTAAAAGDDGGIDADRLSQGVLRVLQVPAPLVAAISGLAQARLALPPDSLEQILFLAHHLSPVGNPLLAGVAPDADSLELTRLVNADARLAVLLAESQRELRSLTDALQL